MVSFRNRKIFIHFLRDSFSGSYSRNSFIVVSMIICICVKLFLGMTYLTSSLDGINCSGLKNKSLDGP